LDLKSKKITLPESEKQFKSELSLKSINNMSINYDSDLRISTVKQLAEEEIIFVEDGNHGNNRPLKHEFVLDGIPFVRIPDLKNGKVDFENCGRINETAFNRIRKGIGQGGDIVLTHRATVGKIAITNIHDPVFVTNPGTTVWRSTNPKILDQSYLYYFMQSSIFIEQLSTQVGNNSTFDYVSLTQQRDLLIAFPTIQKQHIIGHHLIMLDTKIQNLQNQNRILEQMAQAIFKSWFVDFDGVTEFEDSELGKIPKGWSVESLDEHINFLNGIALQKFRPKNNEFLPVIKIKEMKEGFSDKTEKAGLHIDPKYIVKNGDVLFSWSGSLELTVWHRENGALNQHIFKVTSEKYKKWFYYQWVKFHLSEFKRIAEGKVTTMGHIQRHHLSEARILVPLPKTLEKYNFLFSPMFDQILSNRLKSELLTKTRDALLPKLMSGEIRV
jgi:type I restriction enzyme, S subunit